MILLNGEYKGHLHSQCERRVVIYYVYKYIILHFFVYSIPFPFRVLVTSPTQGMGKKPSTASHEHRTLLHILKSISEKERHLLYLISYMQSCRSFLTFSPA